MKIHHLSFSKGSSDGGIGVAVSCLVSAQLAAGQKNCWTTADSFPLPFRDFQLREAVFNDQPSLVHVHGLWRSQTRIASSLSNNEFPTLIAPHGMLNPIAMAHSAWKKKVFWLLSERNALLRSRCLHALSASEALDMRSLFPRIPIAIIPNGVDMPAEKLACAGSCPWDPFVPPGDKVLLFLGRFHSGKGISALLQAWQSVASEAERQGWWLVLVGYGDGGSLVRRLTNLAVHRCMVFPPVFGVAKQAALLSAKAFVLPSHFEALPMAALEAMAYQLPCLLSAACNLPQAFASGAALRAEPEPSALASSLHQLFNLSSAERTAMGSAGQYLVGQQFCWSHLAEQTLQLYTWILGGGERPGFVEIS